MRALEVMAEVVLSLGVCSVLISGICPVDFDSGSFPLIYSKSGYKVIFPAVMFKEPFLAVVPFDSVVDFVVLLGFVEDIFFLGVFNFLKI